MAARRASVPMPSRIPTFVRLRVQTTKQRDASARGWPTRLSLAQDRDLDGARQAAWVRGRYAAVCSAVMLAAALFMPLSGITFTQRFLAAGIIALCSYPVVAYMAAPGTSLPFFPMISLLYAIGYGLPLFSHPEAVLSEAPLPDELTKALVVGVLGVIGLQAGFVLGTSRALGLPVPTIRLPLDRQRVLRFLVPLVVISIALNWAVALGYLDPTPQLLALFGLALQFQLVGLAVLAYWRFSGSLTGLWTWVFWLLLLLASLKGLAKGMLSEAAMPLAVVLAVYWLAKRRVPWVSGAIVVVGFLLLQPVKGAWRNDVWVRGDTGDAAGRLSLWGQLASSVGDDTAGGSTMGEHLLSGATRMDYLPVLARVVAMTPDVIPYQDGQTYSYLLVAAVPRLLWPQKPVAQEANDWFGVAYGYITSGQVGQTMMGIPHLVEAYVNFGPLGTLPLMAVIGYVYALLDRALNRPAAGEGGMAILAAMMLAPNAIESSTAASFGGLVQNIAALALLLLPFRAWRHQRPATSSPGAQR